MKKTTVQELLGRRIISLRKAKNLAKEELAAKCDLPLDFIEAIEKGKKDPSLEHLAKISEVLGVEMFDLFKNEQEEKFPSMIRRDIIEIIDEMSQQRGRRF